MEGGLAWQEYSEKFPHVIYTLGYAGRPGGPAFYISTVDNSKNHGPASQGSKTEADGVFGSIYKGFSVVERMKKQPGKSPPSGFIMSAANFIKIGMTFPLPQTFKISNLCGCNRVAKIGPPRGHLKNVF